MKPTTLLGALGLIAAASLQAFASNPSVVLSPERAGHTGTVLPSGKVLIVGGLNESSDLSSALIYDPSTGTITPTGSLIQAREQHTATLLDDGTGRVLITGGELTSGQTFKSAEIYDPALGTFRLAGHQMSINRSHHTATLLGDGTGRVLIYGGKNADLFDPNGETFTPLGLTDPNFQNRSSHSAVRLNKDGDILITGGYIGGQSSATADIYHPQTGTFEHLTNFMRIPRANHASTLLIDPAHAGQVLVTGGFTGTSPQDEADRYDPVSKLFLNAGRMIEHRSNHRNVLLPNGSVLVVGGTTLESGFLADNEVWDPTTETWSLAPVMMNENRSGPSANLQPDATVFVAGGINGSLT
jgi:hypothetical protein